MSEPTKTVRLTKQHWLNIIIISVSAMLLISVLVGRMINKNGSVVETEKQEVNIVQIDFSEVQFRMVEGNWQSSISGIHSEKIVKIVEAWQYLLLQPGQPVNRNIMLGKTILIYLENVSEPIVARMNLNTNNLQIIFTSVGQAFYLEKSTYSNYYPPITKLN